MKTMTWLVRREFWEHKGMFFWAPIIVGLVLTAFIGASVLYGTVASRGTHTHVTVNGMSVEAVPPEARAEMAHAMASGYMAVSAPLFLMLGVVLFFYCLGAMYDERRDRSILFWKSLPISDQMTVLSKVVAALLVAPLITIAVATLVSVTVLLLGAAGMAVKGMNLFGVLLSTPEFYTTPFKVLGLLPVYVLWALPTIGWLLMVSSWARSKVFLWAVGVPLLAIVAVKLVNHQYGFGWNVDWFIQHVVLRTLGSLFPGVWLAFERITPEQLASVTSPHTLDTGAVFLHSWAILGQPALWVGALAGGAMIFAAMRLRRWRDEG
jgi:ABC-2 type transport system permease protein